MIFQNKLHQSAREQISLNLWQQAVTILNLPGSKSLLSCTMCRQRFTKSFREVEKRWGNDRRLKSSERLSFSQILAKLRDRTRECQANIWCLDRSNSNNRQTRRHIIDQPRLIDSSQQTLLIRKIQMLVAITVQVTRWINLRKEISCFRHS